VDHRFALFGFDSFEPVGGWRDIYGTYSTRRDAEEVVRHAFRSFDHWQLVDMESGDCLWEKSSYELNPCRSTGTLKHAWSPWTPIVRKTDISDFLAYGMLVTPFTVKEATQERRCKRCGEREDDGKYRPIFPALSPLRNLMPRVAGTK
jgi:hypothetical protein